MGDWECFVEAVSWFVAPGGSVQVGTVTSWARATVAALPEFSQVLASSTVTPVVLDGQRFELLAWGSPEARRGWLTLPPPDSPPANAHPMQQQFWAACGGILQTFGGPDTWWSNQAEILTMAAAQTPFAEALADYSWLWEDDGLEVPIDPDQWSAVAVEGNGNLTLAHRVSGQLLLFAPDHDYDGVTPLAGCPPYSLMTIDALPDVVSWVEDCARAWA